MDGINHLLPRHEDVDHAEVAAKTVPDECAANIDKIAQTKIDMLHEECQRTVANVLCCYTEHPSTKHEAPSTKQKVTKHFLFRCNGVKMTQGHAHDVRMHYTAPSWS